MKNEINVICFHFLSLIRNSCQLFAQSENDTLEIKETVLYYLEGMETNSPEKIEKAKHPDLAKRTIEELISIIHLKRSDRQILHKTEPFDDHIWNVWHRNVLLGIYPDKPKSFAL